MRLLIFAALITLSACSWFHSRPAANVPTEFLITGAPAGSTVFVDGAQSGMPNSLNGHPQVLVVTPGPHTVEVHLEDTVVYREDTDAIPHRRTMIRVLSGLNR